MKPNNLLLVSGLLNCVGEVYGEDNTLFPGCAISCWENSKYVSKCGNESSCLCKEADFQNVVFQCLYSQCSTANFGPALHHTISQCTLDGHDFLSIHPPLIRHDGLRKRWDFQADQQSGSLLSSAFATYPTQSAANGQTPTIVLKGPFFTPNFDLEASTVVSPYVAPIITATSAGVPSALSATATPGPELYTGFAPSLVMNIRCPIIVTVTAIMLSM